MRTGTAVPVSYDTTVPLIQTGFAPGQGFYDPLPAVHVAPAQQPTQGGAAHDYRLCPTKSHAATHGAPVVYGPPNMPTVLHGGDDDQDIKEATLDQLKQIHDLICKLTGVIAAIGAACVVLLMAMILRG